MEVINRLVRGRAIDRRIPVASTPSSRIAPSRKLANGKVIHFPNTVIRSGFEP
jgi:hypothetical protein